MYILCIFMYIYIYTYIYTYCIYILVRSRVLHRTTRAVKPYHNCWDALIEYFFGVAPEHCGVDLPWFCIGSIHVEEGFRD